MKIAVLPATASAPKSWREALARARCAGAARFETFEGDVGGTGYKRHGHPLPPETLELAQRADAILFGAVGDPACDDLERHLRPEQAILGLRKALGLFANLRPATLFPGLEDASALRPEVARAIDLLIVRELNGDVYFGEKGMRTHRRRAAPGLSTSCPMTRTRCAASPMSASSAAQAAQGQAVLGRQGQCARDLAAVARRGDRGRGANIPTSS